MQNYPELHKVKYSTEAKIVSDIKWKTGKFHADYICK